MRNSNFDYQDEYMAAMIIAGAQLAVVLIPATGLARQIYDLVSIDQLPGLDLGAPSRLDVLAWAVAFLMGVFAYRYMSKSWTPLLWTMLQRGF